MACPARNMAARRGTQCADEVAVGVGEIVVGAAERDAHDVLVGSGQGDGELVLGGHVAEELRVEVKPVESLDSGSR